MAKTTKSVSEKSTKKRPRSNFTSGLIAGIVFAVIFFGLGVGAAATYSYVRDEYGDTSNMLNDENDGNQDLSDDEEGVADVARTVSPAVVSITSESRQQSIFGESAVATGSGSGIVVHESGIVITNKHVVSDTQKLEVTASDGTVYDDVKKIAEDPLNDLAFLKIQGVSDLSTAQLGNSSSISVGQRVVAIGNSLGQYQNTVTTGIISGTGRPVAAQNGDSVESLTDLIQTDAAINPGNSGGPLINMAGQVIGINTAVAQDAESIGFSIPVNASKGILKQIVNGDKNPQRAYLGVRFIELDPATAKEEKLTVTRGAYVTADDNEQAVQDGGPADKAGIRAGDVITKINDDSVGIDGGVTSLVAAYAPGEKINLTYLRDGKETTVPVTLAGYSD